MIKKDSHTVSVRVEKPQTQTSTRTDIKSGEVQPTAQAPIQMHERGTQCSTPTETKSKQKETPLFCINNGRIPSGVFSPFEIAAEAMKIFRKKK